LGREADQEGRSNPVVLSAAPRIADRTAERSDMTKNPAVYMLSNRPNGTLYVGVTSDLIQRIHQHRTETMPGFASRYGCRSLVWFEQHADMLAAIEREKQLKAGSRARKIMLIKAENPQWRDLFEGLV